MPEYLAPGVYVEEIELGSKPIEGVSTSTTGFLGVTRRGPVNKPIFVTNFGEYRSRFGGYLGDQQYGNKRWVPYAVDGFFANGGKRVYVTRVAKLDGDNPATVAEANLPDLRDACRVLKSPAQKGEQEIDLTYWVGLSVGDHLQIDEGNQAEYVQITGFADRLQITPALSHSHSARVKVVQVSNELTTLAHSPANSAGASHIHVTSRDGLSADTWVQIEDDTRTEFVRLGVGTGTTGEGQIAVTPDLRFSHPSSLNLRPTTLSSLVGTLSASAVAGGMTIRLNDSAAGNLSPGDWIRVQGNTGQEDAQAEVVQITGTETISAHTDISIRPALTYDHTDLGREVHQATMVDVIGAGTGAAGAIRLDAAAVGDVRVVQESWIWIQGNSGQEDAQAEVVQITQAGPFTAATDISIRPNLTYDHANPDREVRLVTFSPISVGDISTLGGAGATMIRLDAAAAANLSQGNWIWIQGNRGHEDDQAEVVQITGTIAATGEVSISPSLSFNHYENGREVRRVTVDSTASVASLLSSPRNIELTSIPGGLSNGDVILLADNNGAEAVRLMTEPPSTGPFTLTVSPALRFSHSDSTPIRRLLPNAATVITEIRDQGAKEITVASRNSLSRGTILEVLDGAQTEYVQVAADPEDTGAGNISLLRGLRYRHLPHTPVRILQGLIQLTAGPSIPDPVLYPEVGEWGNEIRVEVESVSFARVEVDQQPRDGDPALTVTTNQGIEPGSVLRLPGNLYASAINVEGNRIFLDGGVTPEIAASIDVDASDDEIWKKQIFTNEFTMRFSYGGTSEVFSFLSMDRRHSRYFVTVINEASKLVHVEDLTDPSSPSSGEAAAVGQPLPTSEWYLGGGDDDPDSIDSQVYRGVDSNDADRRTGLFALLNRTDISIVAVPGQTDRAVLDALIGHAERARYRFAVLDSEENATLDNVQVQRSLYDSKYAALYYPWVQIYDPLEKKPVFAPPSGHMCGIYARTDNQIGVFKAPANAKVTQVTGLRWQITQSQQDVLNPRGINAIRAFPGRGIRVWGARTISSDSAWRYVNVRRIFIFLEQSIDEATQYAVFEPNDVSTWERLRGSVTAFLTTQWRAGMLQGRTSDEAFFVRIGLGETMTQDDIDNGRMIMLIGVAPVKPAEFVIFRIAQSPGGSAVLE